MAAITRFISHVLVVTFAVMALAAPSRSDNTVKSVLHRRIPAPILATPTRDVLPSACTNGLPASEQHPAVYPINDYTVVTPDANNWTSYALKKDWYNEHFISGPHVMSFGHQSDPYGPFKCQYTCNGEASCNAYFVWYESIGTSNEHLNCVLFDAVIPPSVFIQTNGTITSGAYDRLCDHST